MKSIFFLILVLFALNAKACLNIEIENGQFIYPSDKYYHLEIDHLNLIPESFKYSLNELDSLYLNSKDVAYLSDKGVLLIVYKRYQEAIDLYLKIEKLTPNRYSTASNLGTVYELIGQNDKALYWIEKALRINPSSHNNSEWIHVNILKAKLKGNVWHINSMEIIGTDFGNGAIPKTNLSLKNIEAIKESLLYQLKERISLIESKSDLVINQMIFDLGNTLFLLNQYNSALYKYELALKRGFNSPLLKIRITSAKRYNKMVDINHQGKNI